MTLISGTFEQNSYVEPLDPWPTTVEILTKTEWESECTFTGKDVHRFLMTFVKYFHTRPATTRL